MIWEYLKTSSHDINEMNSLGGDGWELINIIVIPQPGYGWITEVYWKRKVDSPQIQMK